MSRPAELDWPWLNRGFVSTRWSLMQRVAASAGSESPSAAELCRLYWHPLYSFLRSRGHAEAESQDFVQSFLVELLQDDRLGKADANRGLFRSYLTTLLIRHVSAQRTRAAAKKRGAGITNIPFDWPTAESLFQKEATFAASPDDIFRRALASNLVEDALLALRRRYADTNQLALLDEILPALEGPLIDDSYPGIAARLGLTIGSIRVAVVRMRTRFRENLRTAASAALMIPAGADLDAELREIFR